MDTRSNVFKHRPCGDPAGRLLEKKKERSVINQCIRTNRPDSPNPIYTGCLSALLLSAGVGEYAEGERREERGEDAEERGGRVRVAVKGGEGCDDLMAGPSSPGCPCRDGCHRRARRWEKEMLAGEGSELALMGRVGRSWAGW